MIFGRRLTQTDTDISVPRLAGLKESSRSRVKNPLIWSFPKGSTFCFAIVGKAKSLCLSRERSERVAKRPRHLSSVECHCTLFYPRILLRRFLYYTIPLGSLKSDILYSLNGFVQSIPFLGQGNPHISLSRLSKPVSRCNHHTLLKEFGCKLG
jgi:hypothetical protein